MKLPRSITPHKLFCIKWQQDPTKILWSLASALLAAYLKPVLLGVLPDTMVYLRVLFLTVPWQHELTRARNVVWFWNLISDLIYDIERNSIRINIRGTVPTVATHTSCFKELSDWNTVPSSRQRKILINFKPCYLFIICVSYKNWCTHPEQDRKETVETFRSSNGLTVKTLYYIILYYIILYYIILYYIILYYIILYYIILYYIILYWCILKF